LRLALCQLNATVGDIAGNAARIRAGIDAAVQAGARIVLFPELALTGYPPEDLLLRGHFLDDVGGALHELAEHTSATDVVAIVGFPERAEGPLGSPSRRPLEKDAGHPGPRNRGPAVRVYNAAAVLRGGAVAEIYRKVHLPNYGVFDEQRYFEAGATGTVIEVAGHRVGLTVCEDLWVPGPPASEEAAAGASLIVNISASPYHAGKGLERERLFAQRAREDRAHIAFCGMVGGQDELIFDGHSFVLDPTGATIARAAQFEEELLICEVELEPASAPRDAGEAARARARSAPAEGVPSRPLRELLAPEQAEVYAALCLGLRDYVEKNGFERVVLGLSGGIDSALVACVAADALGPERVSLVVMPSRFSSPDTQGDARKLAANLGARLHELEIEAALDAYERTLAGEFAGHARDVTEENLQARIRGNLLMALSNKFGWLVLTTGNKSEMSVGYTTLYGDLAGGFAVIKDVPKTLVYRLCEWRNSPAGAEHGSTPIPPSIIARAPSAELRPDQRDEDSLPPYELLDRILRGYIELDEGREQLVGRGLPAAEVDRTIRLVDLAEYKRRQAPPGIKVTTRAFGRDRRMPITNRYRG
jgi:NAD+ synthase (glutamine-hydrolysing)